MFLCVTLMMDAEKTEKYRWIKIYDKIKYSVLTCSCCFVHNVNLQSWYCRNVSAVGASQHTLEPAVSSGLHFLYTYKLIRSIALKHKSNTKVNEFLGFCKSEIWGLRFSGMWHQSICTFNWCPTFRSQLKGRNSPKKNSSFIFIGNFGYCNPWIWDH